MVDFLKRENKPDLAFVYTKGANDDLPTVVFLSGYRSDMEGTKALYLEQECKKREQSFLRFDYSGHGQSEGLFEEGMISTWYDDAEELINSVIKSPIVLVGSSMGGWISLLLGKNHSKNVAAIIGIAAAPDFTHDIETALDNNQKEELNKKGYVEIGNDYSDEPYVFTKAFLDDGKEKCLLDKEIDINVPVVLIQGMKDEDVPWQKAFRIKNAIGSNADVVLIETGDHRLSTPENLSLLNQQVELVSGLEK
jgi:pimeloyl-ACP methyl ester carboxylesterase